MARTIVRFAAAVLLLLSVLRAGGAYADDDADWVQKLSSRNAAERREAVIEIGRLKDPRYIAPLIRMLGDDEPMIRLEASGALMDLGPATVDPLMAALGTETSPAFLWNAIRILEALGDPKALPPLEKIAASSRDPNIVQAARYTIERLERIKSSKTTPN